MFVACRQKLLSIPSQHQHAVSEQRLWRDSRGLDQRDS
jgi:hypothetical protein